MDEYKPTADDLKDFEEFSNERKLIETYSGRKVYADFFTLHNRGTTVTLLREVLKNILLADLSALDLENTSILDRLYFCALFGFETRELVSVISPELSDDDVEHLMQDRDYPYLWSGLNSWFGDHMIERVRNARTNGIKRKTLPYLIFDEVHDSTDRVVISAMKDIIKMTAQSCRPLYILRNYTLQKGADRGYWYFTEHMRNVKGKVSVKRFLKILLEECQNIPETLLFQFNIITTKSCPNGKVIFSVPRAFLSLVEEYFDIEFTNVYTGKGSGVIHIKTDKRTDTIV
ncbi:MAG: hypothetical protein IKA36_05150 [Clostridia bacterium]|nr:hypothetical protein [Clostridia bacterium]